jgi:iron complex outermembrane receptor protein
MSEQKAFDVNNDNFTDIPQFNQFTFNPKIFLYFNNSTSLVGSITSSFENREGGDIIAIEKTSDSLHTFIENNKSNRLTSQLKFEKKFSLGNVLTLKNSMNYYKRDFSKNSFNLNGSQLSSYSEFSYFIQRALHNTVVGLSFITDNFKQDNNRYGSVMDNSFFTAGVFIQDDWNINNKYTLQTGVRADYHNEYGFFILPRLSVLYKLSNRFYIRTGGGLGYKTPTTFIDEVVSKSYDVVLPIPSTVKSESSQSETIDINYNTVIFNDISFTINQAFYYTQLFHAVIPEPDSLANGILIYENANGSIVTRGYDTNVHITRDELGLFVDYSFTHAQKDYDSNKSNLELTPAHKLNITLTFEEEESWRTGIEAFYTGRQYLIDRSQTRDYWTFGIMVEKIFRHLSVIGNVENVFDVRQTKFEDVVIPPYDNPTFRELWAPLDGIVANIALKIQL